MSDISPSLENKVLASNEPRAVPVKSDQSENEITAKKDARTKFREAEKLIAKMTPEERGENLHRLGLGKCLIEINDTQFQKCMGEE